MSSGDSLDWYYAILGSRYAFLIELRPEIVDLDKNFLLPAEEIIPSGEEMWAAMENILKRLLDEI